MPRAAPQDHGSTLLNFSDICIGNRFSPHDLLHQNRMGYDIASVLHRFFYRFKRFMRRKHQTIRIINQRISGNPRLWLICLGKTAVNDQKLSVTFDRRLSFFASTGI